MRDGKEIYRVVYVGSDGIVLSGENGQVVIPEGVMPLGSDLIVDGLKNGTLTAENGKKTPEVSDAENGDAGETDVEDSGESDVSDWSDESDRLDDNWEYEGFTPEATESEGNAESGRVDYENRTADEVKADFENLAKAPRTRSIEGPIEWPEEGVNPEMENAASALIDDLKQKKTVLLSRNDGYKAIIVQSGNGVYYVARDNQGEIVNYSITNNVDDLVRRFLSREGVAFSVENRASAGLDDVPFQESVRKRSSSLGERDASLKTFDNGKIEQFVKERLETGIEKGEYRVNKKGDKERIIAGAVKAFQMFHDKTITLSDGRVVYFYPDVRSFERNGSDALAWAEYSMHFVTSSGDEIAPKIHERLYSGSKADDIHLIEPIIKEEKVFAKFDDKYPSKDAVVFVGTSSNGKLIEIVTRLDDFGNINANLTEVTAVIKGKKLDNPPHAPLTEVVEAVACHQGAGYSPSTNNNINGFGDLSSAVTQKFDSGNTSRPQIAAGFKKIDFKPGTVNLDLGGGKFDQGTEYLEEKGVTNLIFDPVNRASEHNRKIYEAVKNGGVDTVTCNNVLNVIAESNARSNIILQCAKALKPGGVAYFTVWEGDGSGNSRQSSDTSWQEHRKTADYLDEIKQHFADVSLKNKVITAKNPIVDGKVSSWFTDPSFTNPYYLQGEVKDARGAYDPVSETLHLFEFSDVSTFSHETMHFVLSRLRLLRENNMLSGELADDLATLEKYALDKDGKYDEEKIAKAWEKYLMTGETPNASLKSAFRAFRRWLVDLYNSLFPEAENHFVFLQSLRKTGLFSPQSIRQISSCAPRGGFLAQNVVKKSCRPVSASGASCFSHRRSR